MKERHRITPSARFMVARWWVLLVALLGLMGCEDPNSMFSGRWVSTTETGDDLLEGVPELALGHFGLEVAGIVFYHMPGGAILASDCPCSYVEHRWIDQDERRLEFSTTCGDEASALLWRLEIVDDSDRDERLLVGKITPADGSAGSAEVELRFETSLLAPEDRQCPVREE